MIKMEYYLKYWAKAEKEEDSTFVMFNPSSIYGISYELYKKYYSLKKARLLLYIEKKDNNAKYWNYKICPKI
jgi:hypothetical protein